MGRILVTGGAGYIGSHTCVELLNKGFDLVVADNLSNSCEESLHRVRMISGRDFTFIEGDVCDKALLRSIFTDFQIDAVIHFAGYKAVGESVMKPLMYYRNNLESTIALCEIMAEYNVFRLVFSSSATVYGVPETVPITEQAPLSCTNPYGWSKLMNEQILRDTAASDDRWSIVLLRYFNPIGAHESGLIGEDPQGIPNNLMPFISQVAVGRMPAVHVFGNDYPTPDGTGVRDYIHVVDLAEGHSLAINFTAVHYGVEAINLGTGKGYSVLELINAFELASGRKVPFVIDGRRPGDIASCYADPVMAKEKLGWQASRGINTMCIDSWRWQSCNPEGYK